MNRIEKIIDQIGQHKTPPVHLWKPEVVGEIDIRIDAQGRWFHEGDVIARDTLVRLFSSILWCEGGEHFLVTPAEKLKIIVEDAPFIAHQMEYVEDTWVALTNVHEQVIVGHDNPVELRHYLGQWLPYIKVRYDLWARVNRSIYYQWVTQALEAAEQRGDGSLTLGSNGYTFDVTRVS